MKKLASVILSAIMVISLAACTSGQATAPTASEKAPEQSNAAAAAAAPADDGKVVIGVSLMNQQQQFHISLKEGIEEKAKELGVEVVYLNADLDPAKQISDVEDLITQQVDAIIMSPVDSEGIVGAVQKAMAANIPVITADTQAKGIDVTAHVGSDNYLGGKMGAEKLVELLGDQGGKVIFIGNPVNSTAIDRQKGFEDAMSQHSNFTVLESLSGNGVRDKSMSVTEDVLQSNPDLKGIMGINDDSVLGALAAVEAAGLKESILLVGYDATDEAVAIIDAGNSPLKADVIQYPSKIGSNALETAVKAAKGESVEKSVPVEVGIYEKK